MTYALTIDQTKLKRTFVNLVESLKGNVGRQGLKLHSENKHTQMKHKKGVFLVAWSLV